MRLRYVVELLSFAAPAHICDAPFENADAMSGAESGPMQSLEIGLSVIDPRKLASLGALHVRDFAGLLGEDTLGNIVPGDAPASHLYLGSEFCEYLFPSRGTIQQAVEVAGKLGLNLVLATPAANDTLLAALDSVVDILPETAEILVNDWGAAHFLKSRHPQRRLVAGRQLAKMIKDPRVPSSRWMEPYKSGYASPAYRQVFDKFGIGRIELDVPPFATPELYSVPGMDVTVWAPYTYVAKGRICKIGSLRHSPPVKFSPGLHCHRECLGVVEVADAASAAGVVSYTRGNTTFYRQNEAMTKVVGEAIAAHYVSRLVLAGV